VTVERPPVTWPYALCTMIQVLATDIALYACIMPLLGTFLGGYITYQCELGHKYELFLVCALTFTMIYGCFCLFGEPGYWKHLFAFDKFYCYLLQVRDIFNTFVLVLSILGLASAVDSIANEDQGMKQPFVGEGALYVYVKLICDYLNIPDTFLAMIGLSLPHTGGFMDPSRGENEKFEHGAAYMLFWAILTGCLAKLIYFNTLFTYMRSMEIFISMRPIFEDDDDSPVSSMSLISSKRSRQSRLETDFAKYVRNPTWDD